MTIEIIEVLRRSKQGVTRPFICRGDDDKIYFVKGFDTGRRSQICEWVAGRLAVLMGLPLAHFEMVDVPEELSDLNKGTPLDGLGIGSAFGSQERQVTELTVSTVDQVPNELQQDVLMFDWWVKNADRSLSEKGGNPNLFWAPGSQELVVIDHNQAFDMRFDKNEFADLHVFSAQTQQLAADFFRRDEYHDRFRTALSHWDEIIGEIPEQWWFLDEEMTVPVDFNIQTVYTLLQQYKHEAFWNWR
jgi:hypothetical protein